MNRRMRPWAMGALAVLLAPTGYAMLTQRWGLASVCVVGLVVVRVFGTVRVDDSAEQPDAPDD